MLSILLAGAAHADERFYGPDGQSVGTASTDSAGNRRFYDDRGRSVGTSSTRGGTTTFYDARGRMIGKATR
jgi:YD repeat-containing protein